MNQLEIDTMDKPAPACGHPAHIWLAAAESAVLAIPPAWPLASSVAVNPYLGQTGMDLARTGALLERVAGAPVTMPRDWFHVRIADGRIADEDIAAALAAAPSPRKPASVATLKAALFEPADIHAALPTVADLAAEASGIDWPGIIAERFGAWAGSHFDTGQALWTAFDNRSAYAAWRDVATHDLTPEIIGLRGFARRVAEAPVTPIEALAHSAEWLDIHPEAAPTYFHRLLTTLGGWAQYARCLRWQAELAGRRDDAILDMLAIRMLWEEALLDQYGHMIDAAWQNAINAYASPVQESESQIIDAILQEAHERSLQRTLASTLAEAAPQYDRAAPVLQAAFCIDVRSEVYRRALESIDGGIQTLGFAGFFGLAASHRRFASDVAEHRLPVLLNPGVTTRAGGTADQRGDLAARFRARATRAWGRFKLAAVSSFAFVEASGPLYVGKLVRDALGLSGNGQREDPAPQLDPAVDLPTRTAMAVSILRGMSLTSDFASIVLLLGHGANVVNNPHASALHCGACGGYSGEVNARLLAQLLNDQDVRIGVCDAGIVIPSGTLFVAGLHDTTTDNVRLYADDDPSLTHADQLLQARSWLSAAGALARGERALRLPRASNALDVTHRSRDWAETRPEWALAGCQAFIAAPRNRTAGKNLRGRAFLHDHDWREDDGFGVLELILTAPVVVASWISLQYYGSTVSPDLFGAGNKLLHNVIGGIGVVEGNGGTLRAGLPWQSVHDGDSLVHDPVRLTVCIEAPHEAITAILEKHPGVRELFDNRWLHLIALNDSGAMAWRYAGDLGWQFVDHELASGHVAELAA